MGRPARKGSRGARSGTARGAARLRSRPAAKARAARPGKRAAGRKGVVRRKHSRLAPAAERERGRGTGVVHFTAFVFADCTADGRFPEFVRTLVDRMGYRYPATRRFENRRFAEGLDVVNVLRVEVSVPATTIHRAIDAPTGQAWESVSGSLQDGPDGPFVSLSGSLAPL